MAKLGKAKFVSDRQEAKGFLILGGAVALLEEIGRVCLVCANRSVLGQVQQIFRVRDEGILDDSYPILPFFLKRTSLEELLETLETGGFEIVD